MVNGPIRDEIGMNAGIGAMGPYNHANATIGRAYSLLSQNGQGGSVPGETYMGTLGNPFNIARLSRERGAQPVGAVSRERGFARSSTVSMFFGGCYTQCGYGPRETWKENIAAACRRAIHSARRCS